MVEIPENYEVNVGKGGAKTWKSQGEFKGKDGGTAKVESKVDMGNAPAKSEFDGTGPVNVTSHVNFSKGTSTKMD